jgi:hypothetical protein
MSVAEGMPIVIEAVLSHEARESEPYGDDPANLWLSSCLSIRTCSSLRTVRGYVVATMRPAFRTISGYL